jgi:transposase-like protein/ribosomal protein L37AE/L43A
MNNEILWREFPQTQPAFEARFSTEEACRDYLVEVRWAGKPQCSRCRTPCVSKQASLRWQCSHCHYQMSLTAGTVLHGTRKPLRLWFRAIWEMMSRRNGVSAKDLQRVLGFGSYETAWTWLHKLRKIFGVTGSSALSPVVQVDEGQVGGRDVGGPGGRNYNEKSLVLVAAEVRGRIRLAQALHADQATLGSFLSRCVAPDARVITDGWRGYSKQAMSGRTHEKHIESGLTAGHKDQLQGCHWAIALIKRWWLGTHHGAIRKHHVQPYLDEFAFRYNRHKTIGVGRIVARVLERVVANGPTTRRKIVDQDRIAPWFSERTG